MGVVRVISRDAAGYVTRLIRKTWVRVLPRKGLHRTIALNPTEPCETLQNPERPGQQLPSAVIFTLIRNKSMCLSEFALPPGSKPVFNTAPPSTGNTGSSQTSNKGKEIKISLIDQTTALDKGSVLT